MGARRIRGRSFGVLAVLLTAGLLSACSLSADADTDHPQVNAAFGAEIQDRLSAAVDEAVAQAGASGAVVGVWAPWSGVWLQGVGKSSVEGDTPMAVDSRFRIADNTRAMTCTVLLGLVDDHVVKLDDPVSKYLSRMVDIEGVTLGQLCQNTSGIAGYGSQLDAHFLANPERVWPPLELISAGLAMGRTGLPGESYTSSDTDFVLLGYALQAATQRGWEQLYEQYVFDPLDMADSEFPDASDMTLSRPAARGYVSMPDPETGQPACPGTTDIGRLSNSMLWVGGGVVSTVSDLKDFVQASASGRLVSAPQHAAQMEMVPIGPDAPSWRGYGLGIEQFGPLLGHSGEIPGFISSMMTDPESGLTVVVMLNNSSAGSGFAESVAMRLASIAAKAPASGEIAAPVIELPWSEDQTVESLTAKQICPLPTVEPDAGE